MMISQFVEVKWNNANKKWYIEKKYVFTKNGDTFEARVQDLAMGSHTTIKCLCDYCLEEGKETIIEKEYRTYIRDRKVIEMDCCNNAKCKNKKVTERTLKIHGVDHIARLENVKQKKESTNLLKYGFPNPSQSEEIKIKRIKTNLERFGFKTPLQSKEIQKKKIETTIIRYGVEYPSQNNEVKKKTEQTNIERYGVRKPLQNKDILAKQRATFYKNGTCKTSAQQIEIYNLLKEKGYNVELNYPVSSVTLDVALFIDNIKIDIEYDGWFWHQNNQQKDRKRDEFLKTQGWKILRIKGRRTIPLFAEIENIIDKLANTNKMYSQIIMDEWKNALEEKLS